MIKYSIIDKSEKIVIKIGSSLLINQNKFNSRWLSHFIDDVIFLIKKKKKNYNCCFRFCFIGEGIFKYQTKKN